MEEFKNSANNDTLTGAGSLEIESDWMTTKQAAKYLQTSRGQIQNWANNGHLPFYKVGRSNRFRRSELDSLIKKTKRGGYHGN